MTIPTAMPHSWVVFKTRLRAGEVGDMGKNEPGEKYKKSKALF